MSARHVAGAGRRRRLPHQLRTGMRAAGRTQQPRPGRLARRRLRLCVQGGVRGRCAQAPGLDEEKSHSRRAVRRPLTSADAAACPRDRRSRGSSPARPGPTLRHSHSGETRRVNPLLSARSRFGAIARRMLAGEESRCILGTRGTLGQRLSLGALRREAARWRRCRSRFPHGDSACQRRVPERVVS
jgi:hypothetical protein